MDYALMGTLLRMMEEGNQHLRARGWGIQHSGLVPPAASRPLDRQLRSCLERLEVLALETENGAASAERRTSALR
ncbi:MAG TPA: hypothetical protein VMT16_13745 [Thermoanaerobaculia bacterium]|nr:hypothetical protein [Thermoanaerobaculia bacterium]